MLIDAWWFNNTQTEKDALYQYPGIPEVSPKTHIGIYGEGGTLELPVSLVVTAANSEKILYEKRFVFNEEKLQNDEINIDMLLKKDCSIIDCKILAETLPVLPESIKVEIKSGDNLYSKEIHCEYAKLSGKIVDFSGKPFPSPFFLLRTGFENNFDIPYMWVWSKKDGTYSITVPKGRYNAFFVDDNTYRISTLENWGWHMIVDRDETHDFKVGTGEVYSLSAWTSNGGFSTLMIFFRPMILNKKKKYEIELNGIHYNVDDICPTLNMEDLFVTINGYELLNISLQKIYETAAGGGIMPAYILQVCRLPKSDGYSTIGKQTLIVEYNTVDEDGYVAQSQGRTQFFYSNAYAYSLM